MKIVKCSRCKRYIHKTSKCFHCGNSMGFDDAVEFTIHERAVEEYSAIISLIERNKFSDALKLSHVVVEWMPNFASIFWLRLLAKNKCTSAAELIQKGFDCENDPDFCNALSLSSGIEHSVYDDIKKILLDARKALRTEVTNHMYRCIASTNVSSIKNEMEAEVKKRRSKLFSLWAELAEIEQSMYAIEKDCLLISREHTDALKNAIKAAENIKTESYKLEKCTASESHKYQVRIGTALQQFEQAKAAMDNMRNQHPWVVSFNEQRKKQNEQIQLIESEIEDLRNYKSSIQQVLDRIAEIKETHQKAISSIDAYNFFEVMGLLGEDCFYSTLQSAGISSDVKIPVRHDWQPNISVLSIDNLPSGSN